MESSIVISSYKSSVRVTSSDFDLRPVVQSSFIKEYIPRLSISTSDNYSGTLEVKKGQYNLVIGDCESSITIPKMSLIDIVTLVEYLLERDRQRCGIYCMHGSAIVTQDGGEAIILWGPASGTGKTTLLLSMITKHGFRYYSDEKVLIDTSRMQVVAGVSKISLNKDHLKNEFGHLIDDIDVENYTKKIPLVLMVYPVMNGAKGSKPYYEKWSPETINWHLYEELSRKIRGTSRRFFDKKIPAPSLDEPDIAQERSDSILKFSKKINCVYMSGNNEQICGKIMEIVDSEQEK